MKTFDQKFMKFEFEARIFISFGIVVSMCFLSFIVYDTVPSNIVILGESLGFTPNQAYQIGYLTIAAIMILASFLRMWAGSILTSQRMMAFKVQQDKLTISGPYLFVRNPIYLADLLAFCGFALCLKPIAGLLPILLFLHYYQLVRYEEQVLMIKFGLKYQEYKLSVPRFFPNFRSAARFVSVIKNWNVDLKIGCCNWFFGTGNFNWTACRYRLGNRSHSQRNCN